MSPRRLSCRELAAITANLPGDSALGACPRSHSPRMVTQRSDEKRLRVDRPILLFVDTPPGHWIGKRGDVSVGSMVSDAVDDSAMCQQDGTAGRDVEAQTPSGGMEILGAKRIPSQDPAGRGRPQNAKGKPARPVKTGRRIMSNLTSPQPAYIHFPHPTPPKWPTPRTTLGKLPFCSHGRRTRSTCRRRRICVCGARIASDIKRRRCLPLQDSSRALHPRCLSRTIIPRPLRRRGV